MNKYKIIGGIDILLGILYTIYPVLLSLLVIPKLMPIYSEFSVKPNLTSTYLMLLIIFFIGITDLFLGFKLFTAKTEEIKEKYLKYGIISMAVTLLPLLVIMSIYISQLSVIIPLYNLSTNL